MHRELAHHPHRLAEPVVRAHRDRAPARLAGEPGARARAVPRRRLRRQALHQARGAGQRPVFDDEEAGENLAHDGGAVLHHHQARQHLPHQERGVQGRPHRRARVRGLVERRRLRRHRPARHAEVGLHRARALRHRARCGRLLRALHQPAAGRRAARLRHPAAGVGLRGPHRPDGARARHRPDRVPAQEPAARGPAAGDRHRDEGCGDRARSWTESRRCMDWNKPFDRGTGTLQKRPRHRHRLQGLRLAHHLVRGGQRQRRRQLHRLLQHRGHGAGLRHRDGADRRRGAAHGGGVDYGGALRYRRHAVRHGDARLALAVPYGQRREAGGGRCTAEAQ